MRSLQVLWVDIFMNLPQIPEEKTPPPEPNAPWHWKKRYYDVGDPITWKHWAKDCNDVGMVTGIKINQMGRVSYWVNRQLVLIEDVGRAVRGYGFTETSANENAQNPLGAALVAAPDPVCDPRHNGIELTQMITYEASIHCDICHEHNVSGETTRETKDALRSAIETAERQHWKWAKDGWYCPECWVRLEKSSFAVDKPE